MDQSADEWTQGWSFVIANDELYLNGITTGETGHVESGGTDIFLAKITTGLEDADIPFSGISIIPTAPRNSEGKLQTSEVGSSTSFKVKLHQEPLADEDVVVSLTGLDSTEGILSVNKTLIEAIGILLRMLLLLVLLTTLMTMIRNI